ncbi:hypothetical protein, partial [Streptomyces mutabilis]|uniref:hypothetical protein n=1 Tax=Streptomyces mutabilis TaxID=67332 RepID=UPI0036B0B6D5
MTVGRGCVRTPHVMQWWLQVLDGAQGLVHAVHGHGGDLAEEFGALQATRPQLDAVGGDGGAQIGSPITTDMTVAGNMPLSRSTIRSTAPVGSSRPVRLVTRTS